eukprot:TRINITY_DN131_c8_g1_i1.p1 TRINITY_DN131_c8_g1~~TRINITY_DN131_c8_g1_i1.p1  ORF type:complete len:218 (+),score=109.78 TRINITY_DN131_c8_g1_i1:75-656(+)
MKEAKDATSGLESVVSSVSGLVTPQILPLRKTDGTGTETPETQRTLFTVLEEKKISVGTAMFGSEKTYVLPTQFTSHSAPPSTSGSMASTSSSSLSTSVSSSAVSFLQEAQRKTEAKRKEMKGEVVLNLLPEELEKVDAAMLKDKYDKTVQAQKVQQQAAHADIDEVMEEETKKKKRKMAGDSKKKDKDKFKF